MRTFLSLVAFAALQFSGTVLGTNDAAKNEFDYIIVGGGTAGLTLASRLTEDRITTVAVIEAGDFNEKVSGNLTQIPADDTIYDGKSLNDTGLLDWGFSTTPQAGIGNEVVHIARGKALGGCSALNNMA